MACVTSITGVDLSDAGDLFEQFRHENPESKITLQQFTQILYMRRKELAKKMDVAHIPIDSKVVHQSEAGSTKSALSEKQRTQDFVNAAKKGRERELARLLAQLHGFLSAAQQIELKSSCAAALKDNPPTLAMADFANKVIALCRTEVTEDEDAQADLELGFREYFANVLAVSLDSFETGPIPRRLFPHLMMKKRREHALLRQEGIAEEESDDVSDSEEVLSIAEPNGFGGSKGDYMKAKLQQIPAEKMERFMRMSQ